MKASTGARLLMGGLLLVAAVSAVSLRSCTPSLTASSIEEAALQPGDIIFVDLYSGWYHFGYWDHMALYVGQQPYPGVIEATYDGGICYTPLPAFLARDAPASLAVKRLTAMPAREEAIGMAVGYAMAQVGRDFDFTATATIPMKVTEEKQHCAEVVWRAYKAAGIELDSNDTPFLYPDDLYYSPRLRPI